MIKNGCGNEEIDLSRLANDILDGYIPRSGARACTLIQFKELGYNLTQYIDKSIGFKPSVWFQTASLQNPRLSMKDALLKSKYEKIFLK